MWNRSGKIKKDKRYGDKFVDSHIKKNKRYTPVFVSIIFIQHNYTVCLPVLKKKEIKKNVSKHTEPMYTGSLNGS